MLAINSAWSAYEIPGFSGVGYCTVFQPMKVWLVLVKAFGTRFSGVPAIMSCGLI